MSFKPQPSVLCLTWQHASLIRLHLSGLEKVHNHLLILKRFRDPQFTTNILIYSSIIFLIKNLYFVAVSASYNLVTVRWTGTSDQNQVILPETVLTIPTYPEILLFPLLYLHGSSSSLFLTEVLLDPSFYYTRTLLCKSFSKSLSKLQCGQGLQKIPTPFSQDCPWEKTLSL